MHCTDIPYPFGVRAVATTDNTSIRVSWQWSREGLPMCVNVVRVHYRPEGGSLMMYTAGNTTATTNATLSNLQCDTQYTIWINASGGQTKQSSDVGKMAYLPARGKLSFVHAVNFIVINLSYRLHILLPPPAPPMPTEVTATFTNASSVRVSWQWTSSTPAPDCFNTTTVTYRPEGDGDSSLQLSDPAANETTITGLQCNTTYTITVVATAGEHREESDAKRVIFPQQGIPHHIIFYMFN